MEVKNEGGFDFEWGEQFAEGEQYAIVIDSIETLSKSSGNPMLEVDFGIIGPDGGVRLRGWFVAHVRKQIDQIVRAFFPDQIPAWEAGEAINLDPTKMVHQLCLADIFADEYNGDIRPKVKRISPLSDVQRAEAQALFVIDDSIGEDDPPFLPPGAKVAGS